MSGNEKRLEDQTKPVGKTFSLSQRPKRPLCAGFSKEAIEKYTKDMEIYNQECIEYEANRPKNSKLDYNIDNPFSSTYNKSSVGKALTPKLGFSKVKPLDASNNYNFNGLNIPNNSNESNVSTTNIPNNSNKSNISTSNMPNNSSAFGRSNLNNIVALNSVDVGVNEQPNRPYHPDFYAPDMSTFPLPGQNMPFPKIGGVIDPRVEFLEIEPHARGFPIYPPGIGADPLSNQVTHFDLMDRDLCSLSDSELLRCGMDNGDSDLTSFSKSKIGDSYTIMPSSGGIIQPLIPPFKTDRPIFQVNEPYNSPFPINTKSFDPYGMYPRLDFIKKKHPKSAEKDIKKDPKPDFI